MTLEILSRNPIDSLPTPFIPVHSDGELQPVVTFYYGDFHGGAIQHPRNEDTLPGRYDYQTYLREKFGLEMHVAHRTSRVRSGNVLPTVEVDAQPIFTPRECGTDTFDNPNYRAGTIAESALVVDRDVENFENPYTDGPKIARGIGLPDWQLFNHMSVQEGGNNTGWVHDRIITPADAALTTVHASYDGVGQLHAQYGDIPVITKPRDTASGKGVAHHKNLTAALDAIDAHPELKTHLLQPFIDQTAHIPELKPLFPDDQVELNEYNKSRERLKELCMNMGAYFDENKRRWIAWAYPILIASEPGASLLDEVKRFIALDPESVPEASSIHRKTMQIIGNVVIESGTKHFYGSAAWVNGIGPNGQRVECVNNVDLQSPYMFHRSLFARDALMNMWGTVARQNYERSGGRH